MAAYDYYLLDLENRRRRLKKKDDNIKHAKKFDNLLNAKPCVHCDFSHDKFLLKKNSR